MTNKTKIFFNNTFTIYKKILNFITLQLAIIFLLLINFFINLYNQHIFSIAIFIVYILLCLFFFLIYAIFSYFIKNAKQKKFWQNFSLFSLIIILLTINIFYLDYRYQLNRLDVHDGVIQTEIALKYLNEGKNPYSQNYLKTDLANWGRGQGYFEDWPQKINPALHHYAYPPAYLLISLPFYKISQFFFNWYDQRIVHIFFFILTLIILYQISKEKTQSQSKISLFIDKIKSSTAFLPFIFAFEPLFIYYYFTGCNDIVALFWLMLIIFLLNKKQICASSCALAFATGIKQSIWPLIPFYFFYLFWKTDRNQTIKNRIKKIIANTWPFFLTSIIIFIPFVIWDYKSLIDDIFKYIAGNTLLSYPINGCSLYSILWHLHIIKNKFAYYPIWISQIIFILPLIYILLKKQNKKNNTKTLLTNYIITASIFWFMSRYFNDSHIVYLVAIAWISLFF